MLSCRLLKKEESADFPLGAHCQVVWFVHVTIMAAAHVLRSVGGLGRRGVGGRVVGGWGIMAYGLCSHVVL